MADAVALVCGIRLFRLIRRSRNDLLSLPAPWIWQFVQTTRGHLELLGLVSISGTSYD
jgi:hypothetical protein